MTDLRLVVFDVDGTLVDSQGDITAAMTAAFQGEGLPPPPRDAVLGIVGLSLADAVARLAPDAGAARIARLVARCNQTYATLRCQGGVAATAPLHPHVRGVLDALNAEPETLLAVATGKSRRGLETLIDGHGLQGLFVARHCADDHPSKPHPSMLQACLSETGVPARRAVMVGDTSHDMDMARAAGMLAIGVSWGDHTPDRLGAAHMVIDDIRLLPGLLQQIWGQTR